MARAARSPRIYATFRLALPALALLSACDAARSANGPVPSAVAKPSAAHGTPSPLAAPAPSLERPAPVSAPVKVEVKEAAMGTSLHFIAYTSAALDEAATRGAIARAVAEIKRLEALLSEWRDDSEVGRINQRAGEWVSAGPETLDVIGRGLEAGKLSDGSFDITFQALSSVWKFGGAQEATPRVPPRAEVERLRRRVDYRKVELDAPGGRVRIGQAQQLGLGGIAKGYILDRAVALLRAEGVHDFLAQAGGDLFGSGRKPDGSPFVSGVQDPRGKVGEFFAVIELTDHAFSTAGDYARAYVVGGKRYHHIIDPKTGFPASACRSVTIWAPDATTADAVDDAVFILGPERGLKLVESLPGVGALVVDAKNQVFVSERLKREVKLLKPPSDGI